MIGNSLTSLLKRPNTFTLSIKTFRSGIKNVWECTCPLHDRLGRNKFETCKWNIYKYIASTKTITY